MSTSPSTKRTHSSVDSNELPTPKRKRVPPKCEWIKGQQAWREWVVGAASLPILWIHGPPGCGKTTLLQQIVKEFYESEEQLEVISYYFPTNSDQSPTLVDTIISGFLGHRDLDDESRSQLEEQIPYVPPGPDRPLVRWDHLPTLLEKKLRAILVIDGLDEISNKDYDYNFPAKLKDLATQYPNQIRLLVSSSTDSPIQKRFADCPNIAISAEMVDEDLEQYIRSELDSDEYLASYCDDLVGPLKEKCQGNFLWATLAIEDIKVRTRAGQNPNVDSLPTSLDDVYARCLDHTATNLEPDAFNLRNTILKYLTASCRPLKEREWVNVCLIETNMLLQPGSLHSLAERVCGRLIKTQDGDCTQLIHYSAKDFLQSSYLSLQKIPGLSTTEANASIARLCIGYLSHPIFNRSFEETERNPHRVDSDYALLEYASLFWVHHVSQAEPSQELRDLIKAFFASKNAFAWADTFLPRFLSSSIIHAAPRPSNTARFFYLMSLKSQLVNFFDGTEKAEFEEQASKFLLESYEKALADERDCIPIKRQLVWRLLDLAEVYGWLGGERLDALPLLEEALETARELDDRIEVMQAIADYHKRDGKYEEARILLEDLVSQLARDVEPNDTRQMFALDSLGWVCMRLDRLDEAAVYLQQALDIAIRRHGSTSTHTLRSKVTLAEVLNKLGRAEEAEVLCKELKAQVSDHRETGIDMPKDSVSQLNTLAAVYMQQQKFDEAIQTYETVVDDRTKVFGNDHRMTLWATMQLGIAKQSGGALMGARELFEALLPKQIKILGEHHPDVKESRDRLEVLKNE